MFHSASRNLRSAEETRNPDPAEVRDILAKAMNKERLLPRETATLLNTEDPELVEEIFQTAKKLKQQVYGNRIVLFAPLMWATSASTGACTAVSVWRTRN